MADRNMTPISLAGSGRERFQMERLIYSRSSFVMMGGRLDSGRWMPRK